MSLKEQKEQFVSNLSGGPIGEIYAVTGIALVAFFSHSLVKKWALPSIEALNGQPVAFLIEFYFDVLLLLQSITIFSDQTLKLYVHAMVPAGLVLIYRAVTANHKSRKLKKTTKQSDKKSAPDANLLPKKPFLTAYRAQMMVITNLAILAVDFHAFPRRFAKVETWGTSLMDMGVGLFVFSMGLANSRSVIKNKLVTPQKSRSYLLLVYQNTVKALPVLVLGLIRLVSVKSLEYQEHETEYGIHWNFFMTLGLLPIVLGLLDPVLNYVPRYFVALAIGVIYEFFLQNSSLTQYILDPSNRLDNLLTMNKEGVFSFIGYLSIFIFGQSFGSFVLTLRKTPNNLLGAYSGSKPIKWLTVSTTRGLTIGTIVSFAIFYVVKESRATGSISRRIANLPYVMWVVSYNSAFILGYDLVEQLVGPIQSSILDAINNNGLALFLVANLSTGLVNMSINTLEVGVGMAYVILILYALSWTGLGILLNQKGVYIKL